MSPADESGPREANRKMSSSRLLSWMKLQRKAGLGVKELPLPHMRPDRHDTKILALFGGLLSK
jgi:hypothetical protein